MDVGVPASAKWFRTVCSKMHRDQDITAEARMFARWCERMVRANNRRQLERLVYFVRAIADNNVVDAQLAAADLLQGLDIESV